MLKRILLAFTLMTTLLIQNIAYAGGDLFATDIGRSIDASPLGKLLFDILVLYGLYTCMRVMFKLYRYSRNQQSRISYTECAVMFGCGILLYYPHHTFNLFYNTFF